MGEEFDQRGFLLETAFSLLSRESIFKEGLLYEVEFSFEGCYVYDSYLTETILGYRPRKARLLKVLDKFNIFLYSNLLVIASIIY